MAGSSPVRLPAEQPAQPSRRRRADSEPRCRLLGRAARREPRTSSTVQNRSLMNADNPRPVAKKANRQLSCRASPGSPMPRATKTGPDRIRQQQPRQMQMTPAATPTRRAVPVAADVRSAPATTRVAAVPDEERIGRQAACGVDDERVGDVGERERSEVAGTEGARHEQSQGEVAEARDALVHHTPAEASHGLDQPMLTGCGPGLSLLSRRGSWRHVGTPEGRATGPRGAVLAIGQSARVDAPPRSGRSRAAGRYPRPG